MQTITYNMFCVFIFQMIDPRKEHGVVEKAWALESEELGFNPSSPMDLISLGLSFHVCKMETVNTFPAYHREVM